MKFHLLNGNDYLIFFRHDSKDHHQDSHDHDAKRGLLPSDLASITTCVIVDVNSGRIGVGHAFCHSSDAMRVSRKFGIQKAMDRAIANAHFRTDQAAEILQAWADRPRAPKKEKSTAPAPATEACPECRREFTSSEDLRAHRHFKHQIPAAELGGPLNLKVARRLSARLTRMDQQRASIEQQRARLYERVLLRNSSVLHSEGKVG